MPTKAYAVGVGTISKTLDPVQEGGFSGTNTFATGSLVRYDLSVSCSSNTTDCGIGTIIDQLDPNLEYVGIVAPTQSTSPAIPVVPSVSGQTVTIKVGSATIPWPDSNKLDITLVVRVRSSATGTINNQATLTTNGGTTTSQIVPITVPAPAPDWSILKTAAPTSIALGETVTYTIRYREPDAFGNLDIASSIVTDTIPTGAEVVDAGGGVVSGNTVTWNTATIPFATSVNCSSGTACDTYWYVTLTLRFPAGAFSGGQTPTNNVSSVVTYSDGSKATLTSSATITIVAPVIKPGVQKTGPATAMAGETISWSLSGANSGNTTETNWSLVDTLPTGFANFTLYPIYGGDYQPYTGNPKAPVTFSYVNASGATVLLGTWTPVASGTQPAGATYTIPGDAKQIIMSTTSLAPGAYLYYNLKAVIPSDAAVGTAYTNCLALTGADITNLAPSCPTTTVIAPYTKMGIYKYHVYADLTATSQKPGDVFWFVLPWQKLAGQNVSSINLNDVLPTALQYIPGTACANDSIGTGATPGEGTSIFQYGWYGGCPIHIADPTIVPGTPTSTSNLLEWNNLAVPSYVGDGSHYYVVAFQVRVVDGTAISNYTNVANVSAPSSTTTCAATGYYGMSTTTESGIDLNGNGTTNDTMCTNQNTVQIREAAITSSMKWVKGDVGTNVFESTGTTSPGATDTATACPDAFGGYTRYPCVAEVNPGGTFDYKFDIVNQGNIPLTNYTFYDILPYVGDVGVNQALATSGRLSEWLPTLTGPVTPDAVPAGSNFTVMYSLSTDPCRPELSAPIPGVNWQGAACDNATGGTNVQNTWYTQSQIEAMAGSWANVKSFKVVMFSGVTVSADGWQPAAHATFSAPMLAPQNAPASRVPGVNDVTAPDLSAAWNSLADQVSGINPTSGALIPQLAAAPRKVGVIVPAEPQVQVGDYVWIDVNKDGLQDSTDKPIPGVVLTLTGPDGKAVTDVFGNPVGPQTTDATGHYLFPNLPVLAAGQSYTVTIDKTASATALTGLAPTLANVGTDRALDSSSWTVSSTALTADGDKDLTLDFGFIDQPVSIGDYVWLDNNRDGLQDGTEPGLGGVTVVLKDASGATVGTKRTDANGYYWFDNLTAGAAYTLTFTAPSGYSWTTQNVTGVTDNNLTTDNKDSDVNPADGTISVTAPLTGTNGTGAPDKTDNPTLDGGLVSYNLTLDKALTTTGMIRSGNTVTFTLTPHNEGPSTALAGWSVTDVLPVGLTATEITGSTADYSCTLATLTCTSAKEFAAKADMGYVTVKATVDANATSPLTNLAYVAPVKGDVKEANELGAPPTTPTDASTTPTDNDSSVPVTLTPYVSVGDFVWFDANRDGLQTAGEAVYPNMTVQLFAGTDTSVAPLQTATTNAAGYYSFQNLDPSTQYTIKFVTAAGESFTTQNAGGDTSNSATADLTDSDANPATGTVTFTTTATGLNKESTSATSALADNPGIDAGIVKYNLTLAKKLDTAGPFKPGMTVTYTLTPHNDGPVAALAGWSVTDILPAGLTLVSMSSTDAQYTCTGATCTSNKQLAPASDAPTITVKATIDATFTDKAHNVAYVAPSTTDGIETNPLVVPTTTTDTSTTGTDNDAQADLKVDKVSIGDYFWWDTNRNGQQDADELPVTGATVELYLNNVKVGSTTTDPNGYYAFKDLLPSTAYVVKFINPDAQASFTSQFVGVTATDSNANPADGTATVTTPATGANLTDPGKADDPAIDAGLVKFNLSLTKTMDTAGPFIPGTTKVTFTLTPHNDGPSDALMGWSVTDILPAGLTLVSMTSADAQYTCTGATCTSSKPLTAKSDAPTITVVASIDAGVAGELKNVAYVAPATTDVKETNPLVVPTTTTDTTSTPTDNDAQASLTVPKVSIGDFVWLDTNRDGLQTAGEPPVKDVIVTLTDVLTNTTRTATTDATGYYWFTNLVPGGSYTLTFAKPTGYVWTTQNVTGVTTNDPATDGKDSDVNVATGGVAFTAPTSGSNKGAADVTDNPSLDAGLIQLVSVGDYVWTDSNRDGLQTTGEPPVAGVTVNLFDANGTFVTTATTDAKGFYSFTDLLAGATYTIEFVKPANTVFTTPSVGTDKALDSNADVTTGKTTFQAPASGTNSATTPDDPTIDAGLIPLVSIGDFVWYDTNRDGIQDKGELPVANVIVNLLDSTGAVKATTTTDALGFYSFNNLLGGASYTVEFVKPANTVFTLPTVGTDKAVDSNADVATGKAVVVAPATGANSLTTPDDPTIDAGLIKLVSVGDYVWWDNNRDGLQDIAEPAVADLTVNLYDATGTKVGTTMTDVTGYYSFTDLLAGASYTVEFVKPAGTSWTTPVAGTDDAIDSNPGADGRYAFTAPADGHNLPTDINLERLADDPTLDAGLVQYNLTLTKVLTTTGIITSGSTVTFTLTPHNDGPSAALEGWSVTEVLPSQLTLVSMTGSGYTCTGVTCTATASLAPATDGPVITVTATVQVSTADWVVNVAYVAPNPIDKIETNPLGPVPTTGTDTSKTSTDNDSSAVFAVIVVSPPTTTPVVTPSVTPVAGSSLAYTGVGGLPVMLALALGLLIAGGVLLAMSRRRHPR